MAKAREQNQEQTVATAQKRKYNSEQRITPIRKYKSAGAFYIQDITNRERVRSEHPTLNSSECAHRHTSNLPSPLQCADDINKKMRAEWKDMSKSQKANFNLDPRPGSTNM
jgi:hypothetical protein